MKNQTNSLGYPKFVICCISSVIWAAENTTYFRYFFNQLISYDQSNRFYFFAVIIPYVLLDNNLLAKGRDIVIMSGRTCTVRGLTHYGPYYDDLFTIKIKITALLTISLGISSFPN